MRTFISSVTLLCVLTSALPAGAQKVSGRAVPVNLSSNVNSPDRSTTLPMQLRGNHIYVDAMVNGKPARLLIDNGASVNIFTPEAAKRLGLVATSKSKGEGAATVESSATAVAILTVGAATLRNAPSFIVPLPEEVGCDGFLGGPLFNRFTVTLDYQNKQVTIAEPQAKFTVPGALSLPIKIENDLALVDVTVAGIPGRFQTDTGSKGSLMLFAPFVEKHHLREKFTPRIKTMTGQGVGGFLCGDITRIPSLTLGNGKSRFTLEKLDGELSYQTSGGFYSRTLAGNLGGEILSRFTVTFDYKNRRLFLQKNARFDEPFIGNRSGLQSSYFRRDSTGGAFKVVSVIPGSPASDAGLVPGDVIVGVNGQPISETIPQEVRALFRQAAGTVILLEIVPASGGTAKTVSLTLRDLF